MAPIRFGTVDVDGTRIFYREAGQTAAPALLLLHGFPTSSHMFRDLIPRLADRFHLVAPDLPGFGRSDIPSGISFAKIAAIIGRITEIIGLSRFALYIFDYGAPTGLRLALKHPERVTAIITQNGNAYEEGSARDGSPSGPIGRSLRKPIGMLSGRFFHQTPYTGNIRMA
jgi:pimeloyl-ACP methyl ester carboxylesterase